MKKAYIVHLKDQDVEAKNLRVDRIVAIASGKVNPFYVHDLFDTVLDSVTQIDTDADYVVPMGSSVVNFLAGLALGLSRPKKVKLKVFDATNGRYKELVLKLEEPNGK